MHKTIITEKNKIECFVCGKEKTKDKIINASKGSFICKRCKSHANRWQRYGLTPWSYEKLLRDQKGKCAICEVEFFGEEKVKLAVDHCHTTKVIRGLICIECNTALGQFKDSESIVKNAWRYLAKEEFIKPDWQSEVYTLLRFYFRGDKVEKGKEQKKRLSTSKVD